LEMVGFLIFPDFSSSLFFLAGRCRFCNTRPRESLMKLRRLALCMLVAALAVPALVVSQRAGSHQPGPQRAGTQEAGAQQAAPQEPRAEKDEAERGYAAFYSASLEGHKTACGGTYSSTQLTAAHPKLRCGTKVRVTNLRNGKTVRVTINDHGPLSHSDSPRNRIIDLSYAAARRLDFIKQGTTLVKVEVVR
jgi:rare lipoprotein A